MSLTKLVVNCETGEAETIALTAEEIAELEAIQAAAAEVETARVAEQARIDALRVSAKAKLVAGDPLTAEEAALLIG